MTDWESSLVTKIHSEKEQEKSEDRDNLLKLTSKKLYGEKIHYVLELIQNAEDEESTKISFVFKKSGVIVINNGRPFTEDDVRGICSVKPGSKRKKIGFFGIGFKSVFSVTDKPQIISGKFNFHIERYIYPTVNGYLPRALRKCYHPDEGAIFILPSCKGMPTSKELVDNFYKSFDSKILLFLSHLKKVEFRDEINHVYWEIEKKFGENSEVILVDGRYEGEAKETRWRIFHQDIVVSDKHIIPEGKEGITETRLTLAFPTDDATRNDVAKRGVLYCYLPTKRRTDLHFLVQADFLPTVGRENIAEDSLWNEWLLRELGVMAGNKVGELRDNATISTYLYGYIPLEEEIQDIFFKDLYNELTRKLKSTRIAKTVRGWVKPSKCAIPHHYDLRILFRETDLKAVLQESAYYIDPDLSVRNEYTRAEKVLFELGARRIETRQVIDFLKLGTLLKSKSPEWYLNLYAYLATIFDTSKIREEDTQSLFEELEKVGFVLTDDRKLIPLKDENQKDRLICYPQNLDLSEIHQIFTEGEIVFLHPYLQESSIIHRKDDNPNVEAKRKRVKDWFDNIGVRKHVRQAHIVRDVILPKFNTQKYLDYDDRKNYQLVDYIRNNWSYIETDISSKKLSGDFVNEVVDAVRVKAFRYVKGTKVNEYTKPGGIYFSKSYGKAELMEFLFKGIEGPLFLSPYYLNREKTEKKRGKKRGRQRAEYSWKKFFEILGVWSSPRVVKSESTQLIAHDGYDWIKRRNSSRGHWIIGDSNSDDITKLIEYCSGNCSLNESQSRLKTLWDSLSKNWKMYTDRNFCNSTYGRFYYTNDYVHYNTSSFLEYLRNSAWVQGDDGGFYRPSELYLDSQQNRLLLHNDVNYLAWRASEAFLKDLEAKIEPTPDKVIEDLIAYRQHTPNLKDNRQKKLETIYRFLFNYLKTLQEPSELNDRIAEIADTFEEHALLYIPRTDKVWWKPSSVFMDDLSDRFGRLRGYLEHQSLPIYARDLSDFFKWIGVASNPSTNSCTGVLEELIAVGDVEIFKKYASRIYPYIESFALQGDLNRDQLNNAIFLSENHKFLAPPQLYYNDVEEFRHHFKSAIEILWLPCSWINLENMLEAGGFNRLSDSVTVSKHFGAVTEVDGDRSNDLKIKLNYALHYLKMKNIQQYERLVRRGLPNLIHKLEMYETPTLTLDYVLTVDDSVSNVNNIQKSVYYSPEENRLYKLVSVNLFSTDTAKVLSILFVHAEDEIFLFLDMVFGVSDEEELKAKLERLGIRASDTTTDEDLGDIDIIDAEGEAEKEKSKDELEKRDEEEPTPQPRPAKPEPSDSEPDLVNPGEFIFSEVEKHTPYSGLDGRKKLPARTVKLKRGRKGYKDKPPKRKGIVNRSDAESVALSLVMGFEETENRYPDDRHDQGGIGYDIYSASKSGQELFIEVKHFRGDPGIWQLTPHQWAKAQEVKHKYYVYIVSRLKAGNIPQIDIIRNPVRYLNPDPPAQKQYSRWRNGVCRVVKLERASLQ
ncbi:hypothetical protein ES708_02345 [subsurface metagenome]